VNSEFWLKLFSFFTQPNPYPPGATEAKRGSCFLNSTMAAYIKKVTIFWLNKHKEALLDFFATCEEIIPKMFEHLYLAENVTSTLVFMCIMPLNHVETAQMIEN